jgi:hypothetical protein
VFLQRHGASATQNGQADERLFRGPRRLRLWPTGASQPENTAAIVNTRISYHHRATIGNVPRAFSTGGRSTGANDPLAHIFGRPLRPRPIASSRSQGFIRDQPNDASRRSSARSPINRHDASPRPNVTRSAPLPSRQRSSEAPPVRGTRHMACGALRRADPSIASVAEVARSAEVHRFWLNQSRSRCSAPSIPQSIRRKRIARPGRFDQLPAWPEVVAGASVKLRELHADSGTLQPQSGLEEGGLGQASNGGDQMREASVK